MFKAASCLHILLFHNLTIEETNHRLGESHNSTNVCAGEEAAMHLNMMKIAKLFSLYIVVVWWTALSQCITSNQTRVSALIVRLWSFEVQCEGWTCSSLSDLSWLKSLHPVLALLLGASVFDVLFNIVLGTCVRLTQDHNRDSLLTFVALEILWWVHYNKLLSKVNNSYVLFVYFFIPKCKISTFLP